MAESDEKRARIVATALQRHTPRTTAVADTGGAAAPETAAIQTANLAAIQTANQVAIQTATLIEGEHCVAPTETIIIDVPSALARNRPPAELRPATPAETTAAIWPQFMDHNNSAESSDANPPKNNHAAVPRPDPAIMGLAPARDLPAAPAPPALKRTKAFQMPVRTVPADLRWALMRIAPGIGATSKLASPESATVINRGTLPLPPPPTRPAGTPRTAPVPGFGRPSQAPHKVRDRLWFGNNL